LYAVATTGWWIAAPGWLLSTKSSFIASIRAKRPKREALNLGVLLGLATGDFLTASRLLDVLVRGT